MLENQKNQQQHFNNDTIHQQQIMIIKIKKSNQ